MEFFIPVSSSDAISTATPSFFQVQLPKRVTLEGDFEVGLWEISYPNELHTIITERDSEVSISFFDSNGDKQFVVFHLPIKCYYRVNEHISTINEYISDNTNDILLKLTDEYTVFVASQRGEVFFLH